MGLHRAQPRLTSELITRIRDEIGDPLVTRTGQTLNESQAEFSNSRILGVINDIAIQLDKERFIMGGGETLLHTTLAYTGQSTALPQQATVGGFDGLLKVEDYSNTLIPDNIPYVNPGEIENYAIDGPRCYTIMGESFTQDITNGTPVVAEPGAVILLRPAIDTTLRLTYFAPPVLISGTASGGASVTYAERHTATMLWFELWSLKAAKSLRSKYNEFSPQQQERLDEVMKQFKQMGRAALGPQRIARTRRG